MIGGTAGYNYQFGQVVAGIEGDVDWSGINGTTNNLCPFGCKTSPVFGVPSKFTTAVVGVAPVEVVVARALPLFHPSK